jgi:hypothetical protein
MDEDNKMIKSPKTTYYKLSGNEDMDNFNIEYEVLWHFEKFDNKREIVFDCLRNPVFTDYDNNQITVDFEQMKEEFHELIKLIYDDCGLILMCSRETDLETFETYSEKIYYF